MQAPDIHFTDRGAQLVVVERPQTQLVLVQLRIGAGGLCATAHTPRVLAELQLREPVYERDARNVLREHGAAQVLDQSECLLPEQVHVLLSSFRAEHEIRAVAPEHAQHGADGEQVVLATLHALVKGLDQPIVVLLDEHMKEDAFAVAVYQRKLIDELKRVDQAQAFVQRPVSVELVHTLQPLGTVEGRAW